MANNNELRLNKFIARHLNVGRRTADELIEKGKVLLNGAKPGLGARVQPDDEVIVNGARLQTDTAPGFLYLLLDKPAGYVCSRRQQGDTPTIYSLIPAKYHHLKPVGRLDKDSSGLLLLTNDGDFAHQLTHPSFAKIKQYQVALDKPLEPLHRQMIADFGIQLPDGLSKLQLDRLRDGDDRLWVVTMHEGRNRQIRRTFAALGYTVTGLHRTRLGKLSLDDLQGSAMRELPANAIL